MTDLVDRLQTILYGFRNLSGEDAEDRSKAIIDAVLEDMRAWRMVKLKPVFGEREICSPKRDSIILFDPELLNAYAKDRGIE